MRNTLWTVRGGGERESESERERKRNCGAPFLSLLSAGGALGAVTDKANKSRDKGIKCPARTCLAAWILNP